MPKQLLLDLPQWGGRREGAGRPRTRAHPGLIGPGVPHLERPELNARHPLHVTVRMQPGIGYLRGQRRAALIQRTLAEVAERFGVRIVHYSIQGNHLHLIVEAESRDALSRAMQGFGIRLAKRLNALAKRSGGVWADRYHARPLSSPRQVANAVRYVLGNYRHHAREQLPPRWMDPLSSARAPLTPAKTWLLRKKQTGTG